MHGARLRRDCNRDCSRDRLIALEHRLQLKLMFGKYRDVARDRMIWSSAETS